MCVWGGGGGGGAMERKKILVIRGQAQDMGSVAKTTTLHTGSVAKATTQASSHLH